MLSPRALNSSFEKHCCSRAWSAAETRAPFKGREGSDANTPQSLVDLGPESCPSMAACVLLS